MSKKVLRGKLNLSIRCEATAESDSYVRHPSTARPSRTGARAR